MQHSFNKRVRTFFRRRNEQPTTNEPSTAAQSSASSPEHPTSGERPSTSQPRTPYTVTWLTKRNEQTTTNEPSTAAQSSASSPEHPTSGERPSSSQPRTPYTVTWLTKRNEQTTTNDPSTAESPSSSQPRTPHTVTWSSDVKENEQTTTNEPSTAAQSSASSPEHSTCGERPWLALLGLVLLWILLFCLITVPIANYLPVSSKTESTCNEDDKQSIQYNSSAFYQMFKSLNGTPHRLAGFNNNDEKTTQLIESNLENIRVTMHQDLYELEIDKVTSSKICFEYLGDLSCSDGIMGVVALLQKRSKHSKSWLLISSHYDVAVPRSHDAGAAAMVAVMLETLREITHCKEEIGSPIVFLFNGGTYSPLHSAYSFLEQHKWGTGAQIKAFINLESIGSGGREVLFRSSNNELTDIYSKHVPSPHGNSFLDALRIFQIIPKRDTDVHVLSELRKLPGLELMYIDEGYTYKTQFDTYDRIQPGTLENTGRNLLALTRGIANSDKLDDIPKHDDDTYHVYYDFWHIFIFHYSSVTAQIINFLVSIATFILVAISLCRMWAVTRLKVIQVLLTLFITLGFQLICTLLVSLVAILTAIILDFWDNSMSWFSNRWLVFGLYVIPALLIQLLTVYLYFRIIKQKTLRDSYILMMFLHAQSIIFAVICIILTFLSKPYAYMLMLVLVFYLIPLVLNLVTRLHDRGYCWVILFLLFQIISFLYFTYLFHTMIRAIIPMMGRSDPEINPDLFIGVLAAMGTIMTMSFNTPLFHMYRKGSFLMIPLLVIIIVCFILAFTSVGFPYRAESSPARLTMEIARISNEPEKFGNELILNYYVEDRRLRKQLFRDGFFKDYNQTEYGCKPSSRQIPECRFPLYGNRFNSDEHTIYNKLIGKTTRKRFENVNKRITKETVGVYLVVEITEHAAYVDVAANLRYPSEMIRFWINDVEYPTKWATMFHYAIGINGKATFQFEYKDHPEDRKDLAGFYIYHHSSTEETGEPEEKALTDIVNSLPLWVSLTLWDGYTYIYIQKE